MGAQRELGLLLTVQSQCTLRARRVSISDRFLPEAQVCALLGKAAAGPLEDPFLWDDSILRHPAAKVPHAVPAQSHASVPHLRFCLPLTRDFPLGGGFALTCTDQQVASPMPILIAAAGGLFKKLSDSSGSNSSFQGDLEERKCDINLT